MISRESFSSRPVALVLGGFINSLSLVRELAPGGMPIWILHYENNLASKSRYMSRSFVYDYRGSDEVFVSALCEIGQMLGQRAVIFPTHDFHVRAMAEHFNTLCHYYYMAVNPDSALKIISKKWQYGFCEKIGVPYPRTVFCESSSEVSRLIESANQLGFPLLLKPIDRSSQPTGFAGATYRTLRVEDIHGLKVAFERNPSLNGGGFMASEVIPGGPENIWAYTAYCSAPGHIMAGWTGRKLSQRPHDFGDFSSSETRLNEVVKHQGRLLLESCGHLGIGEPEFKYDSTDGEYKLTEINPRAMMWHIAGFFSGVNLPLIQYYHLSGDTSNCERLCFPQDPKPKRMVFMNHEIMNVIDHLPRRQFVKSLARSLFLRRKRFAIWWLEDSRPWMYHAPRSFKQVMRILWSRISRKSHKWKESWIPKRL